MKNLTPEEERIEAEIKEYIRKSYAFSSGASRECPQCGEPVTGAKLYAKIEPEVFSLYVLPCNHRLGLCAGAPAWIPSENVEVVPFIFDNVEYGPDEPEGGWD